MFIYCLIIEADYLVNKIIMASNILNKDLNNAYFWCFWGKTESLDRFMFISLPAPPPS